jgi:hypothetical protein
MKYAALALALFAAASTAYASGADSSAGLRCGVILGGKSLAYDGGEETKESKYQRLNAMLGTADTEPLRFAPSAAAAGGDTASPPAANDSDRRLPAKLTLATIGCSWR